MTVSELKTKDFEDLIKKNSIVFIDFWAEWCAPCRQFAHTYAEVAKQYEGKGIQFVKVNVEQETELAELFEIRSIPHLVVFKQGIVIYSDSGSLPGTALAELADQALQVDVSAIVAEFDNKEDK